MAIPGPYERLSHNIEVQRDYYRPGWQPRQKPIPSKSYSPHQWGKRLVKEEFGIGAKGISRFLGPAMIGINAYQGYKQGGLLGAGKEVAGHLAGIYALPYIGYAAAGITGAGAVAGVALAAAGINPVHLLARPYVKEHMEKFKELEMGAPMTDPFGHMATMRQRSLMAIQNSRINGRGAVGSEAALAYNPYFR